MTNLNKTFPSFNHSSYVLTATGHGPVGLPLVVRVYPQNDLRYDVMDGWMKKIKRKEKKGMDERMNEWMEE